MTLPVAQLFWLGHIPNVWDFRGILNKTHNIYKEALLLSNYRFILYHKWNGETSIDILKELDVV